MEGPPHEGALGAGDGTIAAVGAAAPASGAAAGPLMSSAPPAASQASGKALNGAPGADAARLRGSKQALACLPPSSPAGPSSSGVVRRDAAPQGGRRAGKEQQPGGGMGGSADSDCSSDEEEEGDALESPLRPQLRPAAAAAAAGGAPTGTKGGVQAPPPLPPPGKAAQQQHAALAPPLAAQPAAPSLPNPGAFHLSQLDSLAGAAAAASAGIPLGLPPAAQALMIQQLLAGYPPAAQTAPGYAAQLHAQRAPPGGRLPQFQLLPYPYAGFNAVVPGLAAFACGLEGSGQHQPLLAPGAAPPAGGAAALATAAAVGGRAGGAASLGPAKPPPAKGVLPPPAAARSQAPSATLNPADPAESGEFQEPALGEEIEPQPLSSAQREWLVRLTSTAFFKDCPRCAKRGRGPVHSATYFDIDDPTAGALCGICIEDHARAGHQILQVRRSTYQDVLRLVDARPLFDASGVQAYSINGHQVLFLRPRPQPGSQAATPSGSSGDAGGAPGTGRPARSGIKRGAVLRLPQRPGEEPQIVARCAIDGRQLMSADARYCSIRCKFEHTDPAFAAAVGGGREPEYEPRPAPSAGGGAGSAPPRPRARSPSPFAHEAPATAGPAAAAPGVKRPRPATADLEGASALPVVATGDSGSGGEGAAGGGAAAGVDGGAADAAGGGEAGRPTGGSKEQGRGKRVKRAPRQADDKNSDAAAPVKKRRSGRSGVRRGRPVRGGGRGAAVPGRGDADEGRTRDGVPQAAGAVGVGGATDAALPAGRDQQPGAGPRVALRQGMPPTAAAAEQPRSRSGKAAAQPSPAAEAGPPPDAAALLPGVIGGAAEPLPLVAAQHQQPALGAAPAAGSLLAPGLWMAPILLSAGTSATPAAGAVTQGGAPVAPRVLPALPQPVVLPHHFPPAAMVALATAAAQGDHHSLLLYNQIVGPPRGAFAAPAPDAQHVGSGGPEPAGSHDTRSNASRRKAHVPKRASLL